MMVDHSEHVHVQYEYSSFSGLEACEQLQVDCYLERKAVQKVPMSLELGNILIL